MAAKTIRTATASMPLEAPRTVRGNARGNAIEADEAELEERMIAADLAGDRTRADAYKRRLERLRRAKAAGLVVLANERARRSPAS